MGVDEVDEAKPLLGKRKRAKALSLWHLCGLYAFCFGYGIATCYVLNVVVHDLWTVLVITFFYGLFNGASLSVSYALAVDCLPTRENGAQWLAMWDVAAFIGTTAGPLICAPVLFFLPPRVQMNGYVANSDSGYIAVMLLGAFFVSFGCYYLEKVREQKVARA
ncbi:hypothetical protein DIPPA_03431 [Diplonema papillatum]|nr:hypothetical protein DIPPA_03431 [Diplonema papillatum]